MDATFARNLARGARLKPSATRNPGREFAAKFALDGKRDTYWTTPDDVTTPELIVELRKPTTFNVVELREHLPLGQRIEAIAVDQKQDGRWVECARATSIGNRRLLRLPQPITTDQVRLRITQAAACPAVAKFGLYAEPSL